MTEQQKQAVAAEVSRRENITAIVWLVIGIVQVLTCAGIIAGAWNIYNATTHFKARDNALKRWNTVPQSYESMNNLIIGLVVNVLLGGVFSALWCIYDFTLRDYAMANREAFDQPVQTVV